MLSPDALVVRAGKQRSVEFLEDKINTVVSRGESPALSVWALDPLTGESRNDTLLRIIEDAMPPHPVVQVSTFRALSDAEFSLILDTSNGQAACHYNVPVSHPTNPAVLEAFINCFGQPEAKPSRGVK
ncbi:hypothetical protein [Naasia lichenicola]|uniref:Uncharacterized protein n=1 Tax=Naasia lichenicola TaxID=2565933 RepID=A0A4S4FRK6_9MICO|nr:hypothetical protein [Naasia lichenicola]THG33004.1 hypothetical protein E6C64_01165 [Naasia lichenicola]